MRRERSASSRQILARLGPELGQKTWAALEDGTPLVTAAERGAGRVVLFHVTANAEWSSLPLSGLFVDMLDRLIALSGTAGGGEAPDPAELMRQVAAIDGFGRVSAADGQLNPVPAMRLGDAAAAPDAPPGLYAGETARVAYNLFNDATPPETAAPAPLSATVDRLGLRTEQPFAAYLLTPCADPFGHRPFRRALAVGPPVPSEPGRSRGLDRPDGRPARRCAITDGGQRP